MILGDGWMVSVVGRDAVTPNSVVVVAVVEIEREALPEVLTVRVEGRTDIEGVAVVVVSDRESENVVFVILSEMLVLLLDVTEGVANTFGSTVGLIVDVLDVNEAETLWDVSDSDRRDWENETEPVASSGRVRDERDRDGEMVGVISYTKGG